MSDIVKTTAGSFAKNLAKWGAATVGIPVVVGNTVVDVVASIGSKFLQNPNDKAVAEAIAEFEAQQRAPLVAMADEYDDKRPPSEEDVHQGFLRFVRNYQQARDHHKREILFNAFFNSFMPGFYDAGLSQILWAKVERLEYPDLLFLRRVLETKGGKLGHDPRFPNLIRIGERRVSIGEMDEEVEYARRLEAERLLYLSPGNGKIALIPMAMADKLRDFAFREMWRDPSDQTTAH